MKKCPFCSAKRKFLYAFFDDIGERKCEAWIDYGLDEDGEISWYAILEPNQYSTGHCLVVLRQHRNTITDCSITDDEMAAVSYGIRKVASRVKDLLPAESVHVATLCEGVPHLHYHLIPRRAFTKGEKEFYVDHYWQREKSQVDEHGNLRWRNKEEFSEEVTERHMSIHGLWFMGYKEMYFKSRCYWKRKPSLRIQLLKRLAAKLRDSNLRFPSSEAFGP